jgi:drug/metabolite transporter (DMT)-like permease
MTPIALTLVLLAAVCHAAWNLIAKKISGDRHFVLLGTIFVSVLWAPAAVWADAAEVLQWSTAAWAAVACSAIVHVLYFKALLHGYTVSDLSVVYPVARGSGPLLALVCAVLLLGEQLSITGLLGALAVISGVFVIAGGPNIWRTSNDPANAARIRRGICWGAITGVCVAGYTVADAVSVKTLGSTPVLVLYVGNLLRLPFMLILSASDIGGLRACMVQRWRSAVLFAVLAPLAYLLVLLAVQLAPLSQVAPAREVSMLFAALLGGTLLGEADRWLRLGGAACIAGGVIALALG